MSVSAEVLAWEEQLISRRWRRVVTACLAFSLSCAAAAGPKRASLSEEDLGTLGVQTGFFVTSGYIQKRLERSAQSLDEAFDFRHFVENGLLPPVVELFDNQAVLSGGGARRERFTVSYRISAPAKLVIAPPTWRDYLIWEAPEPTKLPKKYQRGYQETEPYRMGVEIGHRQALEVFRERLGRMRVDLSGMRLALNLMRSGVIREPQLLTTGELVQASTDVLSLGVSTEAITEPARFQDEKLWRDPEVRLAPAEHSRAQ